jgi:catechol 2,3-dioxygenase-like lactoylglutathione lyase family enzyme
MTTHTTLGSQKIIAFVGTARPSAARRFYRDTLGLRHVSEDQFAIVFDANTTMLRVAIVPQVQPAEYTALGWQVADIDQTVTRLGEAGVRFQRYPGMDQDAQGVWTSPSGARIAWFKDPDGNTLSLTEF